MAHAVVRDGGRILVLEQRDPVGGQLFYAPLGGEIEFGEAGADAIRRELLEEIGATATRVRRLATLENVYEHAGERHQELIFLYEVELRDVPPGERFTRLEDSLECVWMPLSAFRDGGPPLYPDGLLELLSAASPAR